MYESQTQSKKYRQFEKLFGAYFESDKLYSQIYSKHFKKTYAGEPTKRYLKVLKQIQKSENLTIDDINRLIVENG